MSDDFFRLWGREAWRIFTDDNLPVTKAEVGGMALILICKAAQPGEPWLLADEPGLPNQILLGTDVAFEKLKSAWGDDEARKFQQATTHWLRHTGASIEVERGRALKDISEDLGHSSMATTNTIYVQTDDKKRAASGKNRAV